MNPLQFKVHPLLYRWVELLVNPGGQEPAAVVRLILIALAANLPFALALREFLWRTERLRLPFFRAFLLALPANLIYLPLAVTICADVLGHNFRFQDRFFVVFTLFVASQTLAAFYAVAVRYAPAGAMVGLRAGLVLALFLLLVALPVSLVFLGLDGWLHLL